ncbi:MAG: ribonuclease III [Planctomycetota bacterium]|nr:MAG: ribonuclease III [Planctomycetota bacterium]
MVGRGREKCKDRVMAKKRDRPSSTAADQAPCPQMWVDERLGHRFRDLDLLRQGLTHASVHSGQEESSNRLQQHNERLEFLGDTMLGAAIGAMAFAYYPDADEGLLSRVKSQLVSRKTLARAWDAHGLQPLAIIGPQMQHPLPISVRANLLEGLLGAIYLDGGWEAVYEAVQRLLGPALESLGAEGVAADTKNALQMWCLQHYQRLPEYHCERCGGTDHDPIFRAQVQIADHTTTAIGNSRRQAERNAAAALLQLLQATTVGQ